MLFIKSLLIASIIFLCIYNLCNYIIYLISLKAHLTQSDVNKPKAFDLSLALLLSILISIYYYLNH